MKNIKTTIAGLSVYGGTLLAIIQCHSGGMSWGHCLWLIVLGGGAGTGLLLAKDHNVTGGTVSQ